MSPASNKGEAGVLKNGGLIGALPFGGAFLPAPKAFGTMADGCGRFSERFCSFGED
jgi:hypothetical protein